MEAESKDVADKSLVYQKILSSTVRLSINLQVAITNTFSSHDLLKKQHPAKHFNGPEKGLRPIQKKLPSKIYAKVSVDVEVFQPASLAALNLMLYA